jgi:polyferredoxin
MIGSYRYRFSFYVAGLMMGFGLLFGRLVCGFLCPFGLIQELLHKVPFYKVRNTKTRFWRMAGYGKYFMLAVFVIALPMFARNWAGMGEPAFCKYICPAGTLTAGLPLIAANQPMRESIGLLFALKASIAAVVVVGCLSVFRFFCRTLCPLGAFYGFFNKIALYRLNFDEHNCVHCGSCARVCKMDVDPSRTPDSPECIRCGDCAALCPVSALSAGFIQAEAQKTARGPAR